MDGGAVCRVGRRRRAFLLPAVRVRSLTQLPEQFFLSLYHYLGSNPIPADLQALAAPIMASSEGTLFDGTRKTFTKLADRAEELAVRHVVREVMGELKSYLGRQVLSLPLAPPPLLD